GRAGVFESIRRTVTPFVEARPAPDEWISPDERAVVGTPCASGSPKRAWMKQDGELRKVLVIDDDDELAEVVRQVLRDAGYSVATVRHGAAALDPTQHISADLTLLDLAMPIIDGWSFVRQYRRTARKGARIVLLTANGAAPDIARSLEAD